MEKFRFIVAGVLLIVGLFVQSIPSDNGINLVFGTLFVILSIVLLWCGKDEELNERIEKLEDEIKKLKK